MMEAHLEVFLSELKLYLISSMKVNFVYRY